jgi:pimeloyl-ACP methyl ester carboxylesterase
MRADRRRAALALVLSWCVFGAACRHWEPVSCTPFGAPPAAIYSNYVPRCPRGVVLGPWKDRDGIARHACVYEPGNVSSAKPLPLVVFLHPSLFPAGILERWTNLLDYLATADLTGDPSRRGFILVAPEGRDTHHYYPPPDASGLGWDNWYRQLSPNGDVTVNGRVYPENVDAATIDHFIAAEEATGKVDRNRVFVMGWSNGGAMAYLYGLNRPNIAAAAIYSAPDPFELGVDPCPQRPVAAAPATNAELQIANPRLPTYQVHNNCDIAGLCPNIEFLLGQLRALGGEARDSIIGHDQNEVASCDDSCGTNKDGDLRNFKAATRGARNHVRWPGKWTSKMIDFLRDHPLKKNP